MTARRRAWRRRLASLLERFHVRRPVDLDVLGRGPDHPSPCPPLLLLHEAYRSGGGPEVLLFGDSTSRLVSPHDLSRLDLTEMLARSVEPMRTCAVAALGYHSDVYAALLRALEVMPGRPAAVVLPVNVRQFGPEWRLNPHLRFAELIEAARAYVADPERRIAVVPPFAPGNIVRGHPDAAAWQAFVEAPVAHPGRTERTIGDFLASVTDPCPTYDDEWFRSVWAFHFLAPVDPGNPRLRSLADAVATATRMGLPTLVYLSPANHEAGVTLLGDAFDRSLRAAAAASQDVVLEAAGPEGTVTFRDWTRLLSPGDFFIERDVLSHVNEFGRRRMIGELVPLIRALAAPK